MIFMNVGIFAWSVFSPYLFYMRKESDLLSDLNQELRAVWFTLGPWSEATDKDSRCRWHQDIVGLLGGVYAGIR